MSIKLELDANSIKQAITNHIASQGFNLDGKTVEVALVNGRGGNGNRATITISDDESILVTPPSTPTPRPPFKSRKVEEEVEEDVSSNTDQSMYLEQDMSVADDIMKAAEGSSDPFAADNDPDVAMEEFFPKVDPSAVETPKSLF